jgi:hypothetical protein
LNHVPGNAINRDGPSRQLQYPDFISAFGSTADMARSAAGLVPVENDPKRPYGCGAGGDATTFDAAQPHDSFVGHIIKNRLDRLDET